MRSMAAPANVAASGVAPSSEAKVSSRFHPGLAALRGVAALVVVAYHALLLFKIGGWDDAYLRPAAWGQPILGGWQLLISLFNGPAMVTLFFVLSGTVLSLSLSRDEPFRVGTVPGYWVKRGFRLYPLLVFSALFAVAFQYAFAGGQLPEVATGWFRSGFKIERHSLPVELVKNAFGITSSLNSPSWSIKVELLGSFIFPALLVCGARFWSSVATAVVLILAMFIISPSRMVAYINIFAICFFVGAQIVRWHVRIGRLWSLQSLGSRVLLTSFGAALLLFSRRIVGPTDFAPPVAVLLETIGSFILVSSIFFGAEHHLYRSAPLQYLGKLSYSLYLLHITILLAVARLLAPLAMAARPSIFALYLIDGITVIICLALSLLLAVCTFEYIEKPAQRFGHRLGGMFDRRLALSVQADVESNVD